MYFIKDKNTNHQTFAISSCLRCSANAGGVFNAIKHSSIY